jgi:CDP-diacylglycerol--glycerol-3-phosphate 3-phosphatidyltransferase
MIPIFFVLWQNPCMGNIRSSKDAYERSLTLLKNQWLILAVLTILSTLAGAVTFNFLWSSETALRWVGIAGLVLAYQFAFTHQRLNMNHRLGEIDLLPSLGLGTLLTMLRGAFIAWTAGFLFSPPPELPLAWAPAVLYTSALVLDLFDGYAARVGSQSTYLGNELDNEFDALGLLVAISLAVWYGTLPVWFLPIGAARYGFSYGIWLRQRRGLPVLGLPPSTSRRPIAGLTMGFTSAMLWPIVSPPGSTLAGLVFLVPFTASFTRDWLVVSGSLDPQDSRYQKERTNLQKFLLHWFPLVLRFALTIAVGTLVLTWMDTFKGSSVSPSIPANLTIGLLAIGTIMIALGFAGRFSALVLIFPLGFAILDLGLRPLLAISLVTDLGVLTLGTGVLSLWQPEKTFFGRRWGA